MKTEELAQWVERQVPLGEYQENDPDLLPLAAERLRELAAEVERLKSHTIDLRDRCKLCGWEPHTGPDCCPTWYDGCNCSPQTCEDLIERLEASEAEVERLKADNATAVRLMAELWNCADDWHGVRASSHYRSDLIERMRNLAKLGNRWPAERDKS